MNRTARITLADSAAELRGIAQMALDISKRLDQLFPRVPDEVREKLNASNIADNDSATLGLNLARLATWCETESIRRELIDRHVEEAALTEAGYEPVAEFIKRHREPPAITSEPGFDGRGYAWSRR